MSYKLSSVFITGSENSNKDCLFFSNLNTSIGTHHISFDYSNKTQSHATGRYTGYLSHDGYEHLKNMMAKEGMLFIKVLAEQTLSNKAKLLKKSPAFVRDDKDKLVDKDVSSNYRQTTGRGYDLGSDVISMLPMGGLDKSPSQDTYGASKCTLSSILGTVASYKTLFFGVVTNIDIVKSDDMRKKSFKVTVDFASLSLLLDMQERMYAITDLSMNTADLNKHIYSMQFPRSFFVKEDFPLIDDNTIENALEYTECYNQFFMCYKRSIWYFILRIASSLNISVTPVLDNDQRVRCKFLCNTVFEKKAPKKLPSDTSIIKIDISTDPSITNLKYTINFIDSIVPKIYIKTSKKVSVGDVFLIDKNAQIDAKLTLLTQSNVLKQVVKGNYKVIVKEVSVTMIEDLKLIWTAVLVPIPAINTATIYDNSLQGASLFAAVVDVCGEKGSEGVNVVFGAGAGQQDSIRDFEEKDFPTFEEVRKNLYYKYYKMSAYLLCSFTGDNQLYKKGRTDQVKLMYDGDEARYVNVASCLMLNGLKRNITSYFNLEPYITTNTKVFRLFTSNFKRSEDTQLDRQGVNYRCLPGSIVRIMFPTNNELYAYAVPVPDIFVDSVEHASGTTKNSALDIPHPYLYTNLIEGNSDSPSDSSPVLESMGAYCQSTEGDADVIFTPVNLVNQYAKIAQDRAELSREMLLVDRKGGVMGIKETSFKVAMVVCEKDDITDSDSASMHIDGSTGSMLFKTSNNINITADKEIILEAPKIIIISGQGNVIKNKDNPVVLVQSKDDVSYTGLMKQFDSN